MARGREFAKTEKRVLTHVPSTETGAEICVNHTPRVRCPFTEALSKQTARGCGFAIRSERPFMNDVSMKNGARVCRNVAGFRRMAHVRTAGEWRKPVRTTGTGGSVCDAKGLCSRISGAQKQGEAFAKTATAAAGDDGDRVNRKAVP